MAERHLASGEPREVLLRRLEELRDDSENWRTIYRDPTTGDEWWDITDEEGWTTYQYLVRVPRPPPDGLIRIALSSSHRDEALTAAHLLKHESEWLGKLIDSLEEKSDGASPQVWERIGEIIRWSSLEWKMNRRRTLGKSIAEVAADYRHFREIAERAQRLRERAEREIGHKIG